MTIRLCWYQIRRLLNGKYVPTYCSKKRNRRLPTTEKTSSSGPPRIGRLRRKRLPQERAASCRRGPGHRRESNAGCVLCEKTIDLGGTVRHRRGGSRVHVEGARAWLEGGKEPGKRIINGLNVASFWATETEGRKKTNAYKVGWFGQTHLPPPKAFFVPNPTHIRPQES